MTDDEMQEQLAAERAAGDPPKPHRRDPYVAIEILAGHLRDGHDDYHSGAWEDCQENECAETRGIVGDAP